MPSHGLQHSRPPYPSPTLRAYWKFTSNASVMPPNHLILYCPLLLPLSIFSSIRVFSNEWVLHIRWPKYWGFSFSISPSNEYSGQDWFSLGWTGCTSLQSKRLESFLQHQTSKESVLRIRWPKYWSFSFSISPSNGYSGLISFRMDWFL